MSGVFQAYTFSYAVRKSPGLPRLRGTTMELGIGANTAIFRW